MTAISALLDADGRAHAQFELTATRVDAGLNVIVSCVVGQPKEGESLIAVHAFHGASFD